MTWRLALVACLLCPAPCQAQALPVVQWADWASYGTAAANPVSAAAEAWRGPGRACHLARLAIQEGIGNGVTLGLKHVAYGLPAAVRPCEGCPPDGWPSGHTMNSALGLGAARWGFARAWPNYLLSAGLVVATGLLRHEAHRHTWPQVLAGAGIGLAADASGYLLRCEE
jgi:membrane-associated phospholipid phosphatase